MKRITALTVFIVLFTAMSALAQSTVYTVPLHDQVVRAGAYGKAAVECASQVNQVAGVTTVAPAIWPKESIYTFRATAGTIEISSSDDDDKAADTGARTVVVEGLDANYAPISETITMAGQAAKVDGNWPTTAHSTKSFLRVNRAYVATSGTSKANEGVIYIHSNHGGTTSGVPADFTMVYAIIPLGYGQSEMAVYTVPAGYTGVITSLYGSTDVGTCELLLQGYEYGESWKTMQRMIANTGVPFERNVSFPLTEKMDVKLTTNYGVSRTVGAGFKLFVQKN